MARRMLLFAHHVDQGIDRNGRYRGMTGQLGEIGGDSAREA
jgi:hypothetical protein